MKASPASSTRSLVLVVAFFLSLVSAVAAQRTDDDPQRVSLIGLRRFAVHALVQGADGAGLPRFDLKLLRTRLEEVVRQEGLELQGPGDVRDGAAAQINLLYLIIPIRDEAGHQAGFAASSCLNVSQLVRIPRVIGNKRFTYTMAPTWSSCGMIVGDTASYRDKILKNAGQQIARFRTAWRAVNTPDMPSVRFSL